MIVHSAPDFSFQIILCRERKIQILRILKQKGCDPNEVSIRVEQATTRSTRCGNIDDEMTVFSLISVKFRCVESYDMSALGQKQTSARVR
jgi:hypothetical protein